MSQEEKINTIVFGLTPQLPYSVEEAINRLRINISFLGSDVRKIMIISSEPNEGKSFVAMNLWNQIAEAGEKGILVDADMRNSTMATKYDLHREDGAELKGTSHFLAGNAELNDVLFHTKYGKGDLLPNVENIINPSMLLETRVFEDLLNARANVYRYVFVDAPPLGLVSDGERIGNLCDGAILCVRSGSTPKGVVRESVHQLERAGCPLLGIVLNRVNESKSGYYHSYYSRRYGSRYGRYYFDKYYGKDSKKDKK
ncbi:MAG: CpsD/CapB family tyrosine-protein kinase [Eggerthellaceae bacterium]|nr:CpsD/CapB family tyrosine-protein kinase [Eggerthellaceae bacterium]